MKRSEMVSKIASVILNFNEPNSYVDRKKALEIAEVILQVQEDNGMLPPETYYMKYDSQEDDDPFISYNPLRTINEWDEE